MLAALPLMIVPLVLYNVALFGFIGVGGPQWLDTELFSLTMVSGAVWAMTYGNALIVAALVLLFVEIVKAARPGPMQIADHLFSMLIFVIFLIEFLLLPQAATDVFFILMAIAFIDVVAGFSVSIRTASRDVSIGL
jgi:hypothetical protein